MRVLVTGGAGFIGSHLVDALVARGDHCTVIDDLSRGTQANLQHHGHSVELVEGCVTDRELLRTVAADQDAIFHLASVVGVRSTIENPSRVVDVAVTGTANVLAAARPDAAILVASSSEVYGQSPAVPYHEATPSVLGPPTAPRWSYAHAKACSEHLALSHRRGRSVAVVRYFNVYGPRMPRLVDPPVVARFFDAAQAGRPLELDGDGSHTRSFVYVNDAVRGSLAAIERSPGLAVNLGSPFETSISQLADLVDEAVGSGSTRVRRSDRFRTGSPDPARRSATGTLAQETLGWRAATQLRDGLAVTWATWPGRQTTA